MADAADGASLWSALARVVHGRCDTHVGRQGAGVTKRQQVDLGDHAGRGVGSDAVDGGEQLADAVLVEAALDVAIEALDALAQRGDVLADIASLQAVRGTVMASYGVCCQLAEAACQLVANAVPPVVLDVRVPPLPGASEPSFVPTLVHARTLARAMPQDTVRVRKLGRGRQSQCRGPSPKAGTATLSRNCVPPNLSAGLSGMCCGYKALPRQAVLGPRLRSGSSSRIAWSRRSSTS